MKAKRETLTALQPLAEAIAQDARNKIALNKQFSSFYEQMKEAMRFNAELKELEVPLERVKASVELAAWGKFFGTPMVTMVKHKSRKG